MSTPIKTVAEIKPGALFTYSGNEHSVVRAVKQGDVEDGLAMMNTRGTMFWCKPVIGGQEKTFTFTEPIDSRITDFRMP